MNIIKVLSFLLVLTTIVSCKTTKDVCDIEYYEDTVFVEDSVFIPGDHIHLDDEHLCGWSHDTTVVICLELPIKIPKPINR
jgi:hypothetical protein